MSSYKTEQINAFIPSCTYVRLVSCIRRSSRPSSRINFAFVSLSMEQNRLDLTMLQPVLDCSIVTPPVLFKSIEIFMALLSVMILTQQSP